MSNLLYMIYILKIGGDFMAGRFFVITFLYSLLILSQIDFFEQKMIYLSFIFIIIFWGLYPKNTSPLFLSINYIDKNFYRGIADECRYYFEGSSLIRQLKYKEYPLEPKNVWVEEGKKYREEGYNYFKINKKPKVIRILNIGFKGFYGGPYLHIIDDFALSDALLSKLPAIKESRIGHFLREMPEGYIETLEAGENLIKDEKLKNYYEKLKIITKGKIFTIERFIEIIKINLGFYNK